MLTAVRQGTDRAAFALVYAEHHRRLVRLAYLLTSDPDRAEDVVADAFTKVWRVWRRGEVDDVGAYLHRAVVNTANTTLRQRYRDRTHAVRRDGDDRGVLLPDEQAAQRDQVWQAIQRLPERQRQVVVLRFYEDLDVAATAAVLDVSEGTVKSQTSRAMQRLGSILEASR